MSSKPVPVLKKNTKTEAPKATKPPKAAKASGGVEEKRARKPVTINTYVLKFGRFDKVTRTLLTKLANVGEASPSHVSALAHVSGQLGVAQAALEQITPVLAMLADQGFVLPSSKRGPRGTGLALGTEVIIKLKYANDILRGDATQPWRVSLAVPGKAMIEIQQGDITLPVARAWVKRAGDEVELPESEDNTEIPDADLVDDDQE